MRKAKKKNRNPDNPKGLEYNAVFKPDLKRMVEALRIICEYKPEKPGGEDKTHSADILPPLKGRGSQEP